MKKYIMNRKTYQNVRKMDHQQMSAFLEGIYKNGYSDGCKASQGLTASEIKEVLLQVKGIGEKKVDTIVEALEAALKEKEVEANESIDKSQKIG